jgi:hypothetical protein
VGSKLRVSESDNSGLIAYSGPSNEDNSWKVAAGVIKPGSTFIQICKWSSDRNPEGFPFAPSLEPTTTTGELHHRGLAGVSEIDGMAVKD